MSIFIRMFFNLKYIKIFFIYYFNFWYYHDKNIKKYLKSVNLIFFIQKKIYTCFGGEAFKGKSPLNE
jgi:hypothetical protein